MSIEPPDRNVPLVCSMFGGHELIDGTCLQCGAKNPAAVALGRLGGLASKGKTSPAKAAAARANGAKNTKGRPPGAKDKQPRQRRQTGEGQ